MPTVPLADLKARVGESRVTVEGFLVEPGKVEEFARAVKDDNPAHRDPEAAREQGFERVPAPLTFVRTSAFPRYRTGADFDLGFRPEHVVHGEHAFEFERPLFVGDELTGTTTLVDVYQREGDRGGTMTFAELETAYRTPDGATVVVERATVIETAGAIDSREDEGDD